MSRIFPFQFPQVTDPAGLDSDDPFLISQDGLVVGAHRSAARPLMLPSGLNDVGDFSPVAGGMINNADATAGWQVSFPQSGGVSVSTATFTEGTGSIVSLLRLTAGVQSKLWYTPTLPLTIAPRTIVALDIRFQADGPTHTSPQEFEARVADGANINSGNINRVSLAAMPYDSWQTIVIPLAGLSNITSIGVFRAITTTGGATDRVFVRIDNVRFLNETALDRALSSSTAIAWVPPNYTPDANQTPPFIPAGKAIIDPALGVYSNANKVIQLHDYMAHVPGAETGLVDVSVAFSRVVNAAPSGFTVRAAPGAVYRFDSDVMWTSLRGVEIDFTGSIIILMEQRNAPFLRLNNCTDVTLRAPTILGYKTTTHNGSTQTVVAGTPTVSGTGMLLDALNEEVQMQDNVTWDLPHHFARVMPQQIGIADDNLGPRNYFTVTLSDTTHVASDCVITIYDGDSTTVLASSTLTLTSTPTAYPITYFPTDLGKRLRLTVKKATATANVITLASIQSWGRVDYESAFDVGAGIVPVNTTRRTTIVEPWIEGVGGDAIQISDANVRSVLIIDPMSRACRRQGYSFNRGEDMVIVRPIARETGRSGIDIEPFQAPWMTRNVKIYDAQMFNITNYGFAMQNWARNFNCVIDGCDMYETRLGVLYGGGNGAVLKNLRNWSQFNYGSSVDFDPFGSNMHISFIRTKLGVQLHTFTNTYDDGTGVVTFTPSNNIVDTRTITVFGGTGLAWVAGYRDVITTMVFNTQTGNYTLILDDAANNKIVATNTSTANTVTVPPNVLPVGTQVEILQLGSGQTTIAAGAGVTIPPAPTLKLAQQNARCVLLQTATNVWICSGEMALT